MLSAAPRCGSTSAASRRPFPTSPPGQRDVAEFGIGLAAAVALDAFILRTVLVPAAMHLFGNANWWLPRWLDRCLPYLAIEPTEAGPAVPAALTQQGALR